MPKIGQDEAQSTVRDWFDAVLAQDYGAASELTIGDAADRTRVLADGFQRAADGNSVRLVKQRLDLSPGAPQGDGSQMVRSEFDVQIDAQVGPISVAVQRLTGSADFYVGRVENRTRITEISNVTGLPVAQ